MSFRPVSLLLLALPLLPACERGAPSDRAAATSARPVPVASVAPVAPAERVAGVVPWNKPVAGATATLQKIAGSIVVGGRAYAILRELSDGYGPRLTGSPVHEAAARWARDAFQQMGVDDAHLESFTFEAGWDRAPVTLRTTMPGAERTLAAAAVGWTPGTSAEGVRGEVVTLGEAKADAIRAQRAKYAGKVVLVPRKMFGKKGPPFQDAIKAVHEVGALAVLMRQGRPNNALGAHSCIGCGPGIVGPIPMVDVGAEDGAWLERRLEDGPVTVSLVNESRVRGPVQVSNVVAEIRGREKPDEYVVVGGHLDAWDFASGAQDDGAGVAEVMEAARAIAQSGERPRRSIRFALWVGEEQGLFGSRDFVARHKAELDKVVAMVNTDHGAGAPKGWKLDAREDMLPRVKALVPALFAGLGAPELVTTFECDTDHCPFMLEGVPTLDLDVEVKGYMEVHHAESDTIDKVKEGELAAGAANVAVAAFAIADAPERIAPRATHDAVVAAIKGTDWYDDLLREGWWKP